MYTQQLNSSQNGETIAQRNRRIRELNAFRNAQNAQIDLYQKKKDEIELKEQEKEANIKKMVQEKFRQTSSEKKRIDRKEIFKMQNAISERQSEYAPTSHKGSTTYDNESPMRKNPIFNIQSPHNLRILSPPKLGDHSRSA